MNRFFAAVAISALSLTAAVPAVRAAEQVPAATVAPATAPVVKQDQAKPAGQAIEHKSQGEEGKTGVEHKKDKQSSIDLKHSSQTAEAPAASTEKKADSKTSGTVSTEQAKPATK